MKLISLNTWGGKHFDELIHFIKQNQNTDIFCFQEIYDTKSDIKEHNDIRTNLLEEITQILPDFEVFYFKTLFNYDPDAKKTVDFDLAYGTAIFAKDNLKIQSHQNFFVYKPKLLTQLKKDWSNLATPLQYISFNFNGKKFSIFNFHGTPFPPAKKDTKKRLEQSKKINQIMEDFTGAKILVGDFNLSKNTKSIKILEKDMINLIKEIDIKATRSKLSPFYGKSNFQKFADYTFVSKEVNVKEFSVPDVKISDHLPMILQFS